MAKKGLTMVEKAKARRVIYDVKCPTCYQDSGYQTSQSYNPKPMANPGMVELKEPYKTWGWFDCSVDPTAGYGCMECHECGAQLAPGGKLKVRRKQSKKKQQIMQREIARESHQCQAR